MFRGIRVLSLFIERQARLPIKQGCRTAPSIGSKFKAWQRRSTASRMLLSCVYIAPKNNSLTWYPLQKPNSMACIWWVWWEFSKVYTIHKQISWVNDECTRFGEFLDEWHLPPCRCVSARRSFLLTTPRTPSSSEVLPMLAQIQSSGATPGNMLLFIGYVGLHLWSVITRANTNMRRNQNVMVVSRTPLYIWSVPQFSCCELFEYDAKRHEQGFPGIFVCFHIHTLAVGLCLRLSARNVLHELLSLSYPVCEYVWLTHSLLNIVPSTSCHINIYASALW